MKSSVLFGTLFGFIMILEFFIFIKLDVDGVKNPTLSFVSNLLNYLILPSIFVVLAVLRFKNKYNQGYIGFSEVLRVGTATTVIAALVFGIFNQIYNYLSPEFIEQTIEKMRNIALAQREEMLSQGATETDVRSIQDIEQYLAGTRKSMQSFFSVAITIVMYSLIGIVISLIVGAFTKKDKPQSI